MCDELDELDYEELEDTPKQNEDPRPNEEPQQKKEVRSNILIISDGKEDGLKKVLKDNNAKFMIHNPVAWDCALFDEELQLTDSVQSIIAWKEKADLRMLQVLFQAEEDFPDINRFWIITENQWERFGERGDWSQLDTWVRIREASPDNMLEEMVMKGLEIYTRAAERKRRHNPGKLSRQAKKVKMDQPPNSQIQALAPVNKQPSQALAPVNKQQNQALAPVVQKLFFNQNLAYTYGQQSTGSYEERRDRAQNEAKKIIQTWKTTQVEGQLAKMQLNPSISQPQPRRLEERIEWPRSSPPWPIVITSNNITAHCFFRAQFGFSNFHNATFTADLNGTEHQWRCVEQFYCAHKALEFRMVNLSKRIIYDEQMAPVEMKNSCDRLMADYANYEVNPKPYDQQLWNEKREQIMLVGLRAKSPKHQAQKDAARNQRRSDHRSVNQQDVGSGH